VDPLDDETGTPYAYTGGDPVNGTDPLGLSFWGAITGAVTHAVHFVAHHYGDIAQVAAGVTCVATAGTACGVAIAIATAAKDLQDVSNAGWNLDSTTLTHVGFDTLVGVTSGGFAQIGSLADAGEGLESESGVLGLDQIGEELKANGSSTFGVNALSWLERIQGISPAAASFLFNGFFSATSSPHAICG